MSDTTFADTDFVYIDPDTRTVVSLVEWKASGEPVVKMMPEKERVAKDGTVRKSRKRPYPWGSYRTMKKIYKLEGKEKEAERTITLNEVIEKAIKEPYWN